jgi:predicted HTH transcriptional regulator
MKKEQFKKLLAHGSDTWLDWQESFPLELLKGDDNPGWEVGQAKFLRDLAAMANRAAGETGYLIYGVKDHGAHREVTGIFKSWKEKDFQGWAKDVFDPPLPFSYKELAVSNTVRVGIFSVALNPDYPHVVKKSLGGVIHAGQVWFRRGSENRVALQEDLRRMFCGPERSKQID